VPRYTVEITSGWGPTQEEIEARDEIDALADYIGRGVISSAIEDYDEKSDPRGSYRPHGEAPWKRIVISVGLAPAFECEDCGEEVDTADGYGHTCEED
jgi:hypothetical protein